ncbi:MAG: DUF2080 family transposase-associated protein [Paraprevotella sp.]|nr:DUF2080 family transposase-associated protein [Paraprevotella sp.]
MSSLPPMDINVRAYAVVDKVVKTNTSGKTGYVYLPKTWAGKRIRICLMDELEEIE